MVMIDLSGQIVRTLHSQTPKGDLVVEFPLFQEIQVGELR